MLQRILLKISGEALSDEHGRGIDAHRVDALVSEIASLHQMGTQVAIVSGGGNFWRFRDFQNMNIPRTASDQIGMMATVMNVMTISNLLNTKGISAHMYCAFGVESIVPRYQIFDAQKSLMDGKIVLLAGGTGHPFFTTDTTATLRALELECDAVLKATKVDGVYDSDPEKNPEAQKFETLTFDQAIEKNLRVMDQTAFSLCRENDLPIIVYNGFEPGNAAKIVQEYHIGTRIHS